MRDIFAENHMDVFYPCITEVEQKPSFYMQSLSIVEWIAIRLYKIINIYFYFRSFSYD